GHRGELAAVETAEARDHFIISVAIGLTVFGLALLTGLALTFAIAAAVWHRDDRGLILAALTLTYLLATIATAWGLRSRLRRWRPLAEIRRQLREDGECIGRMLPE